MNFEQPFYSNRATRKKTQDNKTVDANGSEKTLPNNLKRTSPGKRPTPSFSSHGNNAEKTIKPTNITNTQRIMPTLPGDSPCTQLLPMRVVLPALGPASVYRKWRHCSQLFS
jgi:hypothetical protein